MLSSGDFVVEYAGELMSVAEADEIEDQTYIYYFQCGLLEYRYITSVYFVKKFSTNLFSAGHSDL